MIRSRQDLKYYLEQDRKALNKPKPNMLIRLKEFFFPDPIWKYERLLRYAEYYHNTRNMNILHGGGYFWYRYKLHNQSVKLGFSIPLNVCESGLSIVHYGTIVINHNAHIGKNCRIHACVNIGASAGKQVAPTIGDNVYIGPGAILYGDIMIANNITIGANSTVNKSFEEEGTVIAGSPASVIKKGYPNWLELNKFKI